MTYAAIHLHANQRYDVVLNPNSIIAGEEDPNFKHMVRSNQLKRYRTLKSCGTVDEFDSRFFSCALVRK